MFTSRHVGCLLAFATASWLHAQDPATLVKATNKALRSGSVERQLEAIGSLRAAIGDARIAAEHDVLAVFQRGLESAHSEVQAAAIDALANGPDPSAGLKILAHRLRQLSKQVKRHKAPKWPSRKDVQAAMPNLSDDDKARAVRRKAAKKVHKQLAAAERAFGKLRPAVDELVSFAELVGSIHRDVIVDELLVAMRVVVDRDAVSLTPIISALCKCRRRDAFLACVDLTTRPTWSGAIITELNRREAAMFDKNGKFVPKRANGDSAAMKMITAHTESLVEVTASLGYGRDSKTPLTEIAKKLPKRLDPRK